MISTSFVNLFLLKKKINKSLAFNKLFQYFSTQFLLQHKNDESNKILKFKRILHKLDMDEVDLDQVEK